MSKPPGPNRRRFCGVAAATVAAGPQGILDILRRANGMTDVMIEVETGGEKAEIRPFHVSFSDAELAEMRRRIKATRWPTKELVKDRSTKAYNPEASRKLVDTAFQHGLLLLGCGKSVVRVAPPLVIDEVDIDRGLDLLGTVLSTL